MSDDLDTNIENYSYEELLEIVGFDNADIPNNDEIDIRLTKIINKYKLEKNENYVKFFIQAKKKLLNNKSNVIINDESNPIINREKRDIQNTKNLDINKDTLNPTLKQVTKKYIVIDSKYRQEIIPYSSNPNSKTSSTKFICTLTEKIKNTIRLKLNSISISRTWYTFDDYNGNTCFFVDILNKPIIRTQICITEGNYTPASLRDEINKKLENHPSDLSGLSVELVDNILPQKIKFINSNTTNSYTIYFYKFDNSLKYHISCNNKIETISIDKYDHNLGYYLGYRIINKQDTDLKITLDTSDSKIADAPINIIGTQYLSLVIDDYNYNHVNNGGITIENKQHLADLPSYYGTIIQDISCIDSSIQNIYLPTFPRKLTQAQIYSMNEINSNKKEQNNRTLSHNNSNIIAVIHLPTVILNEQTTGMSYNIELNNQLLSERNYFGPVCIEKLHISLYDDKGNILNLHGHDWSLTLIAEEIYQY